MRKTKSIKRTFIFHDTAAGKPEKSGEYLCLAHNHYFQMPFSVKHGAFNAFDWQERATGEIIVDSWAEIPIICNQTVT